jgi:diguanylate cyclase (GGDEF)-like protein
MNRDVTPGIGGGTNGRHPDSTGPSDLTDLERLASGELSFAELLQAPMATLLVVDDPDGHADVEKAATVTSSAAISSAAASSAAAGSPAATDAPEILLADNPPAPAADTASTRSITDKAGATGPTASADLMAHPELELPAAGAPGTPFLADPQHGEPVLLSALAVAGALTCWASAAPRPAWIATAALVPLSAWAVHPGRPGRTTTLGVLVRALLVLAAALTTILTVPSLAGLAVLWVIAAAALYPVLLPRDAATVLTSLGVLGLCLPAAATLLRGDVAGAGDPAMIAGTVAGAVIVGGLGIGAAYLRAALADAALLAEQRHAAARTARDELVRVTSNDGLTSLPNRATLLRRTTQGLGRNDVIGGQLALFVLEIDRFTAVTDTLGPAAADEVLRQVARRLRAAMPAEDLVARIGSRRFAVLVEGVGPEGCTGMARRMTALLEEPMTGVGRTVSITCSIGIAVAGPDLMTAEDLLRAADDAVEAAQRNGRTRWATFDQAMRAHARSQGTLEIELRQAVRDGGIGVAFQPVLALGQGGAPDRLCGLELVARWNRDDGTAVPSLRFLPIAEELGLTPVLGLQLLDQGLAALLRWREAGMRVAALSLDVSCRQLEDPDFARSVAARLRGCGVEPHRLVIEIPAASFVDTEQTRNSLAMLRSLGVGIVVDGFGRAGMSLTALRQLPVTAVKLDRTLAADLGGDDTLPATMVSLCRSLGLRCLVDGVETQAQLDGARALGVDAVQGYLIGRPVAAEDVLGALAH